MAEFGALESAIMDVVWSHESPVTVREVLEVLNRDRNLAYTTVMTVLDTLHRKGWLNRDRDGRAWRYIAAMSREAYTAELMSQALSGSPDPATVLLHLVGQMTAEETAQLRAALRKAQRTQS